jgi:hypothetical protein
MKLRFELSTAPKLFVTRDGDRKAKPSGFTYDIHGWGKEIHLLHLIRQALNAAGFNIASIRVANDGHLMGDNNMRYLRTPIRELRKGDVNYPYLYIFDSQWAIRSSAEEYNNGNTVCFNVVGNPFKDYQQPDWVQKVKNLCDQAGIECVITQEKAA